MAVLSDRHPWDELDEYRGSIVKGKWPTLPELFRLSEKQYPDKISFSVFHGKEKLSWTFSEAYSVIRHEAAYLSRMGIRKGDKVLLMGKNSPDWAFAYFAIPEAGGVAVPMDCQMKAGKCVRLAAFADVRFVIADPGLLQQMKNEDEAWFSSLLGAASLEDSSIWMRLSEADDAFADDLPEVSEDDTAAILFTSGTTGNEKGVVLTHANITSDVYMTVNEVRMLDCRDVTYALLPLHHSYCCTAVLLEAVRIGAECLFGHGFAVSRMLDDLKRGGVTVFMGIPLLYNKLLTGITAKIREKGKAAYAVIRSMMEINSIAHKITGRSPLRRFFQRVKRRPIVPDIGQVFPLSLAVYFVRFDKSKVFLHVSHLLKHKRPNKGFYRQDCPGPDQTQKARYGRYGKNVAYCFDNLVFHFVSLPSIQSSAHKSMFVYFSTQAETVSNHKSSFSASAIKALQSFTKRFSRSGPNP